MYFFCRNGVGMSLRKWLLVLEVGHRRAGELYYMWASPEVIRFQDQCDTHFSVYAVGLGLNCSVVCQQQARGAGLSPRTRSWLKGASKKGQYKEVGSHRKRRA